VNWPGGPRSGFDDADQAVLTFATDADAQQALAYAERGAVATACQGQVYGTPFTLTVSTAAIAEADEFSYVELQAGIPAVGEPSHRHWYAVRVGDKISAMQLITSTPASYAGAADSAVLSAMAARLR
jgi:hypothetical protein